MQQNDTHIAPRVLVAIADPEARRIGVAGLRSVGFAVSAPTDGEAAMMLVSSFSPDVIVVSTTLSAAPGRPLYDSIRETDEQYVICIAPENDFRSRIHALQSGADDAVSLPIHPEELAARCEALMRRPRQRQQRVESLSASVMELGPLTVDLGRREVRVGDDEVQTTRIEFSLLEQLCRRPTEVCTREDLLDAVWGTKWVGDNHVVDVHLSNLRRKLDKAAPGIKVIHTVRGVGFRRANDVLDDLELARPITG